MRPTGKLTAIAAGPNHCLGLKPDGSIVAWGGNASGECNVPSSNRGFVAMAAGGYHSLGLKADGSIVAWGDPGADQDCGQTNVPCPNEGFVAIAASDLGSLALKADSSIAAWGLPHALPSPNAGLWQLMVVPTTTSL